MLSRPVDWEFIDRYSDDKLIFQPKYDGIRAFLFIDRVPELPYPKVRLISRNGSHLAMDNLLLENLRNFPMVFTMGN